MASTPPQQPQPQEQPSKPILPLPEPETFTPSSTPTSTSTSTSTTTNLSLNGDGVKLDHMGPMVVNADGTLSRIANWGEMAAVERENTLRILGRRNKTRLEALRKASATDDQGKAE
ncbi:Uu.00g064450.m01.CDS01 [Anthostomella pinea]|uniref:Uu.00g064450.m01.CDS01 n=1 Tax=Anthostomella pinea TaxID=933095 RepID=A0AAI8YN48_9PEZI|nr:Uu.00g064450.m01.CDS01 [Anthostomella pinea]